MAYFVIYGTMECRYCNLAKELLAEHRQTYFYYDIREEPEAKRYMLEGGYRTVPQILRVEKGVATRIGGYVDLKAFLSAAEEPAA